MGCAVLSHDCMVKPNIVDGVRHERLHLGERARQPGWVLARDLFEWQGGGAMKTDLLKRITIEPGKCGGRPCIRGMRIRVTDILQLLSAGAPYEEILEDYPDLQRDDILAAIEYAAHQTDHVVLQGV